MLRILPPKLYEHTFVLLRVTLLFSLLQRLAVYRLAIELQQV